MLKDMNIVITGGSSGIGREVLIRCLEQGACAVGIGKSERHIEETKSLVEHFDPNRYRMYQCDLTSEKSEEVLNDVLAFFNGNVSGLVNSCGTIGSGGIEAESLDIWDNVLNANLRAVYFTTQRLLSALRNSGKSSIVNVSSVCSLRPCSSISYSVSKAGLDMMTKCLAKELARYGIRANTINPGVVETNLQYSAGLFNSKSSYEDWIKKMEASHPIGRIGKPRDISELVLFLLSDASSWITGSVISIDGGRSIA